MEIVNRKEYRRRWMKNWRLTHGGLTPEEKQKRKELSKLIAWIDS
jgi:hypothetical protein